MLLKLYSVVSVPEVVILKTDAVAIWPAKEGLTVQVPVAALYQPGCRVVTVRAAGLRAEGVQDGYGSRRRDFEDRSKIGGPAGISRPVEVAIGRLHQWPTWLASVVCAPREDMKAG